MVLDSKFGSVFQLEFIRSTLSNWIDLVTKYFIIILPTKHEALAIEIINIDCKFLNACLKQI
jgi:hypothetical protein